MRHGHRNMYRMTGLPGWIRFGYSPGWGGMPPCVEFLSQTEQLSDVKDWFQQRAETQSPQQPRQQPAPQPMQSPQISKEQEIQMLEEEIQTLESQIAQIQEKIKQLRE